MGHHKDGLTANCPHFQQRLDYWSGHWIRCTLGSVGFKSRIERDYYYKGICCKCGHGCTLNEAKEKK